MAVQSSIIDKDAVHRVVSILLAADEAGEECPDTSTSTSALCIIDAFDISKFRYDPIKKIFYMYVFPPCIFIWVIGEQLKNDNRQLDFWVNSLQKREMCI